MALYYAIDSPSFEALRRVHPVLLPLELHLVVVFPLVLQEKTIERGCSGSPPRLLYSTGCQGRGWNQPLGGLTHGEPFTGRTPFTTAGRG